MLAVHKGVGTEARDTPSHVVSLQLGLRITMSVAIALLPSTAFHLPPDAVVRYPNSFNSCTPLSLGTDGHVVTPNP